MTKKPAGTLPRQVQAHAADRTLSNSNPYLIPYLTGALNVLDVGCGRGGLTIDIARRVHPGSVVGIDPDESAVREARRSADRQGVDNVMFLAQDIHDHELPAASFDVVTNSLLLHWLDDPLRALVEMASLARSGGWVVTLDYDLVGAGWYPPIPAFERFFEAFCAWRAEQGYWNDVGRRLPHLYRKAGLRSFQVRGILDVDHPLGPHYHFRTDLWSTVVEGRGPQIIEAGFLRQEELETARAEYAEWRRSPEACQLVPKVFLAGRKP